MPCFVPDTPGVNPVTSRIRLPSGRPGAPLSDTRNLLI